MTARKIRRLKRIESLKKKGQKSSRFKKFSLILIAIFAVLAVGFFFLRNGLWDGKTQFSAVFGSSLEDVLVLTIDPSTERIVTIRIPKETDVDVAHQLGVWPVGSVWDLGKNENLDGDLLAKTVTKTFKFPIQAWGSYSTLHLIKGNIFEKLSAIFSIDASNLSFHDKVRLALFSLQTPSNKRIEIDLADTSYLSKMTNFQGESVYHLKGDIPTSILKIFSDSTISSERLKIGITNLGVSNTQINEITEIIEVLGTKVISIENHDNSDADCVVRGSHNSITAQKLASVFSCDFEKIKDGSNLDLELELGSKFKTRF